MGWGRSIRYQSGVFTCGFYTSSIGSTRLVLQNSILWREFCSGGSPATEALAALSSP